MPIAVADMSVASTNIAATLRLESSAGCAVVLATTPFWMMTMQRVPRLRVPVPAVNTKVAVAVPERVEDAVNVVVPQPLVMGDDRLVNTKCGSSIDSTLVACRGADTSKVNARGVAPPSAVFRIIKVLLTNSDAAVCVDIPTAAGEIVPMDIVAPIVRAASFADCGVELVVIPVAIPIEHLRKASIDVRVAVNLSFADTRPESIVCTVKRVVAHPLVVGVDVAAKENPGTTRSI